MNRAGETAILLSLLVRSMVTDRAAVQVKQVPVSGGVCFKIQVAPAEVNKLIGRNGRVACLLRQVLWCIAQENGTYFELVVSEPAHKTRAPDLQPGC